MTVTALLEITVKADDLQASYAAVRDTLVDTRAFPGCEGVEVLVDATDPAHLIIVERWASAGDDAAYRAWRAGEGAAPALGAVLTGRPVLTLTTTAPDL